MQSPLQYVLRPSWKAAGNNGTTPKLYELLPAHGRGSPRHKVYISAHAFGHIPAQASGHVAKTGRLPEQCGAVGGAVGGQP